MALSKKQAESMNLADTYAFSGTVSGAGAFQKVSSSSTTQTGLSSVLIPLPTTTDFTSLKLILRGLKAESAANQKWGVRFRESGGSVVTSSSYNYLITHNYSNGTTHGNTYNHDLSADEILLTGSFTGDGSDDSEMTSVEIDIHNSQTNGRYTRGFLKKSIEKRHTDAYNYGNDGSFYFASTAVVDAIQIRINTSNTFTTFGYALYKTLF